ncbi:MAG TPA: beta-N-acetylhexosaminidase [Acholeplasmatales bacterium]|nr:beta-N-acetylhexosaminidase [Acholeplasmatales bacterium]
MDAGARTRHLHFPRKDKYMTISKMTLREKIGQMLCFAFHNPEYDEQIATFIHEFQLGGVIYFQRNIKNIEQVAALNLKMQSESKIPLFIGLDQEGGPVLRIMKGITPLPGAMALSAADPEQIHEITKTVGENLRCLGFNLNFAPVGDVNNNPANPVINSRSYSDDPEVVAKCAVSAFKGFQDGGILPTIKHFPGHGNTSVDSHLGLPVVKNNRAEVFQTELVPFKKAIAEGIDGVMISHILYENFDHEYPASLSYNIITCLLKEKLGFKGLIVTDSLTMGAISSRFSAEEIVERAVNAGNDLLIFCGKADLNEQREIVLAFEKLAEEGKISKARIDESVKKILRLKAKYAAAPDIDVSKLRVNTELAQMLQNKSVTLVYNHNWVPIKAQDKVLLIFPEIKLASLVDNVNQKYQTMKDYLDYPQFIINNELANLPEIALEAPKYDKIILGTYNVLEGDHQTKVFEALPKNRLMVVSLRSPYDCLLLKGIKNYVCIYELTPPSLQSCALALKGAIPFSGKLPIRLTR